MTVVTPTPPGWEYVYRKRGRFSASLDVKGDVPAVEKAVDDWLDRMNAAADEWDAHEAARPWYKRLLWNLTSPRVEVRRAFDGLTIRLYRKSRPAFVLPPFTLPPMSVSIDNVAAWEERDGPGYFDLGDGWS